MIVIQQIPGKTDFDSTSPLKISLPAEYKVFLVLESHPSVRTAILLSFQSHYPWKIPKVKTAQHFIVILKEMATVRLKGLDETLNPNKRETYFYGNILVPTREMSWDVRCHEKRQYHQPLPTFMGHHRLLHNKCQVSWQRMLSNHDFQFICAGNRVEQAHQDGGLLILTPGELSAVAYRGPPQTKMPKVRFHASSHQNLIKSCKINNAVV